MLRLFANILALSVRRSAHPCTTACDDELPLDYCCANRSCRLCRAAERELAGTQGLSSRADALQERLQELCTCPITQEVPARGVVLLLTPSLHLHFTFYSISYIPSLPPSLFATYPSLSPAYDQSLVSPSAATLCLPLASSPMSCSLLTSLPYPALTVLTSLPYPALPVY